VAANYFMFKVFESARLYGSGQKLTSGQGLNSGALGMGLMAFAGLREF